ncbi:MAG: hypothetical protein KIT00_13245 [Rhodospirillales bacterium]|nr:hypothetical protein [Rhodospirillales bacterium]
MGAEPPRREFWTKVGYGLTAAWMVFVVVWTDNDPSHPFFNFIFAVPLAGWITVVAVVKLVGFIKSRDP